jgi:plastocyanin
MFNFYGGFTMRLRFLLITALFLLSSAVSAKEIWLSIGGTTAGGTFRTDARIFNPSTTKDIQIQAYYLPVGNVDNSAVQPISITVLKRQQLVYNDVVTSLFHSSGLGAIRLKSDDDFVATHKIYADTAGGTLGQYVAGVDATSAKAKGILIQLQNNGSNGQTGTFRTNVGAANPNPSTATVTWRLYDKNNNQVGKDSVKTMLPFQADSPSGLSGYAVDVPATADLSDAWLSYSSDKPIVAYGSVIDNGTTDPTYIPAAEDTGTATTQTPAGKVFVVTEVGGPTTKPSSITIAPNIVIGTLKPGDTVTFQISAQDSNHGFRLVDPDGNVVLDLTLTPGAAAIERTVTLVTEGTWGYYCTNTTCSNGHNSMQGTFPVGNPTQYVPPGY